MTIVDLDGTLVTRNTFSIFTRRLITLANGRHRYGALTRIGFWGVLRKCRIIGHKRLKWNLMKIADGVFTEDDYAYMANKITSYLNLRVGAFLKDKEWVLATAASEEYVKYLALGLGCSGYVATRRPASMRYSDYIETRGETKLKEVRTLTGSDTFEYVLSDHLDDLPLLSAAKSPILVRPHSEAIASASIQALHPTIWK